MNDYLRKYVLLGFLITPAFFSHSVNAHNNKSDHLEMSFVESMFHYISHNVLYLGILLTLFLVIAKASYKFSSKKYGRD